MQTTFQLVMYGTLVLAVITFFAGILNMGNPSKNESKISNKLMMLRVGICTLLFIEMIIYALLYKV